MAYYSVLYVEVGFMGRGSAENGLSKRLFVTLDDLFDVRALLTCTWLSVA